ncbi:hypothetical protein CRM22_003077 [Opisthorchis felineus]|uniref:Uncharacterized protein n=1 Tax=Opisthorchis felineus TaxID=147828 RepID=A0A4S2M3I7_OPIFE|nr:hypothetical protein CRM22_003077 [Opisthorchis felineus]
MEGCVERTPYVSLIALVLTFTGSGLMCGTNYEALRRTDIVFTENFYPVNSPQILQIIGIVYSVVTMLFSIVNFATGTCATGKTRERVYAHKKAQSNGRNYSRFLLVTNYFVTLTWILLFVAFAVPVGLWAMLHTICREETEYWRNISADKDETLFTYTFNLTHYGLYRRPIDTSLYSESINSPSVFTHLCQEIALSQSPLANDKPGIYRSIMLIKWRKNTNTEKWARRNYKTTPWCCFIEVADSVMLSNLSTSRPSLVTSPIM